MTCRHVQYITKVTVATANTEEHRLLLHKRAICTFKSRVVLIGGTVDVIPKIHVLTNVLGKLLVNSFVFLSLDVTDSENTRTIPTVIVCKNAMINKCKDFTSYIAKGTHKWCHSVSQ